MTQLPVPDAPRRPVVVAVEGLCFTGKTSLAARLADRCGAFVAGEYADLAPLPPFPPTNHHQVVAALEHFLALEHDRARQARASGAAVVVCDRSPLTVVSYEIAMAAIGVPHDPGLAADMFSTAAEHGATLTPNGYLYLHISARLAAARERQRGPVAAHLSDPRVRHAIDAATRTYLRHVPPPRRLILNGADPPADLAARAAAFLAALPPPGQDPAPSWRAAAPTTARNTSGTAPARDAAAAGRHR